MNSITLNPISYVKGIVNIPGSKSISNRILLLSALSNNITYLSNLLDSDDIKYMFNAFDVLGIKYKLFNKNTSCIVYGSWDYIKNQQPGEKKLFFFLGNAGTVVRPLIAILSLIKHQSILTGTARMQERPIGTLVNSLMQCGANINYLNKIGYLPIKINGGFNGGHIIINECISSQFLTALLIIAPLARIDTVIQVKCDIVSKSYVDMTIKLMRKFNVVVECSKFNIFYIKGKQYYKSPLTYNIEGDATSASYFLAAAAIKGGPVKVKGIGINSIQGDVKFANILEQVGAKIKFGDQFIQCKQNKLYSIDIDMNEIPDSAMTLAMVGLFTKGEMIIRNIFNWRVKESNRLIAMSSELIKVGAIVKIGYDYISIIAPKFMRYAIIDTYNDHRIAMCFSLVALSNSAVTILNPKCTNKTFPNYFHILKKISY